MLAPLQVKLITATAIKKPTGPAAKYGVAAASAVPPFTRPNTMNMAKATYMHTAITFCTLAKKPVPRTVIRKNAVRISTPSTRWNGASAGINCTRYWEMEIPYTEKEKLENTKQITVMPVNTGGRISACWEYMPPSRANIEDMKMLRTCCSMVTTMAPTSAREMLRPVMAMPLISMEKMPAPITEPTPMEIRSNSFSLPFAF